MWRPERCAIAVVATTLLAAAPATAATVVTPHEPPAEQRSTEQPRAAAARPVADTGASYADPLRALGAASPTCKDALGADAQRNCRRTGSVEHSYPLSSYGFDVQIDFSLAHMERSFLGALQNIAALAWMALVYLTKGVLLLLQWGFSIDLLGSAMQAVRGALHTLHRDVIGEPWFLAALSVAGLWGMWRGLVQRQAAHAITGLAATVALMVCGLVILARPDDTIGYASHLANQAALGILSAARGQDTDHPSRSLADASIDIFDQIVRDPWCALEFGSVTYCDKHAKGSRHTTNADVWLQYPAGSDHRTALYHLLKGEPEGGDHGMIHDVTNPALDLVGLGGGKDPSVPDRVADQVAKDPDRAALQDSGGTVPRFALLALIAIGMTGAIALLAYLGIRLLLASVLALLLLLFAPAVLLAPAFGESGRATFVSWLRRLLGALAAKLIYALLLAVVLIAAEMLRRLDIGWFGTWLLQIAFWWGVLLKRHELVGLTSAGHHDTQGGVAHALSKAYYGLAITRTAQAAVHRHARRPAAAVAAARQSLTDRRHSRGEAVADVAGEQLDAHASRALTAQQAAAQRRVHQRHDVERELRAVDRRLARYDDKHATTRAQGAPDPEPTDDQRALLDRRAYLLARLRAPELQGAGAVLANAQRNHAQGHGPVGPRDRAAWRAQRAADLRADLPPDHESHLSAAGIDPATYRRADETERARLRRTVEAHVERERALLAAAEGDNRRSAGRELALDPEAVRRASAERLAQRRAERNRQRERANLLRR